MRNQKGMAVVALLLALGFLHLITPAVKGQANSSARTVPVHMVVMVEPLSENDNTVSAIRREDVQVRQGKNRLQVTDWIPAREDQAGLQLLILIDDTSDTSLGVQL